MSVLVECFSVVVRCSAIASRYPGGMAGYEADCPNKTLCTDGDLVRVGFMQRGDVEQFLIRVLARAGLASMPTGLSKDLVIVADSVAIVEQRRGPWDPEASSWLEYTERPDGVCLSWLAGQPQGELATPLGWTSGGRGAPVKLDLPGKLGTALEALPPVPEGYVRIFTASVYGTEDPERPKT